VCKFGDFWLFFVVCGCIGAGVWLFEGLMHVWGNFFEGEGGAKCLLDECVNQMNGRPDLLAVKVGVICVILPSSQYRGLLLMCLLEGIFVY